MLVNFLNQQIVNFMNNVVLEFSRHFLGESSGDDLSYPVPIISINNDWLERLFSLTGPCAKANVAIEIVCFFLVGRKAHLRPTR